jgi:uncharacterized protein (TIGR02391 family)
MEYLKKLLEEGVEVSKSRIPSGSPFIYDQVNSIMYQKWVMNCISMLKDDAPDHVEQIRSVYDPKYNLINQFEQIFGIVSSAVEYILHKWNQKEKEKKIEERPATHFNLDFLHPKVKEKCADHFYSQKYDDAILNACKVVEVLTRESAKLSDDDIGVSLMRKAFNPKNPILKYSDHYGEQESLMHLFSGFIGVFKNPQSHRFIEINDPLTAFEVINFANHLCKIIEGTRRNSIKNDP